MKKKTVFIFTIIAISVIVSILSYNRHIKLENIEKKYIKFENIKEDIEERLGYDITIKKTLKKAHQYYIYTYVDDKNQERIGMAFYKQKFSSNYKFIGASWPEGTFGDYAVSNQSEGYARLYCIFGENTDRRINNIKVDFGEETYNEDVSNEDYYLRIYKFTEEDLGIPDTTFYNSNGEEIPYE